MRQETFEKHADTLQNIEFEVIQVYKKHPELSDWNVDNVYEGLQRVYRAESGQRPAPVLKLSPLEQELYESVKAMCDLWLGVRPEEDQVAKKSKKMAKSDTLKTHEDILECLKQLRSSVKLWTKNFGRQGYLNYVGQFIT